MAKIRVTAWQRTTHGTRSGWGLGRFASTMLLLTAIVYALTYLNVFDSSHLEFSQMRLWRSLVVGAAIAVVTLPLFGSIWQAGAIRVAMLATAIGAILPALWLLRSQSTVDDVAYLKSMIPNHSIAILASSRAHIRDERVRRLADEILARQLHEIDDMKRLIATLERDP